VAVLRRLGDLGDLGRLQADDLGRDALAGGRQLVERVAEVADPVAGRVPGDGGLGEAEAAAEGGADSRSVGPERSQRAGGARQLRDRRARRGLAQPLARAPELVRP
jgi:hypothetical protein